MTFASLLASFGREETAENIDNPLKRLVGVRGFEPPTPASRRQCSTKLSYTPTGVEHRL